MSLKLTLHIVVALQCEANPIITHFQLKKILTPTTLPFSIFTDKNKTIYLIISGVGKIKASIATTFLYCFTGYNTHSCFLNIGIAGSQAIPLGEAILANKITDVSKKRSWYPFVNLIKHKQACLATYDHPQDIYNDTLIDMEAAAFFQSACSFVNQEHIQVLKIISDNDLNSQKELDHKKVAALVFNRLKEIEDIAQYLLNLSHSEVELHKDFPLDSFLSHWHFTFNQQVQLKESLRRWNKLVNTDDPYLYCLKEKDATAVLKKLVTVLNPSALLL